MIIDDIAEWLDESVDWLAELFLGNTADKQAGPLKSATLRPEVDLLASVKPTPARARRADVPPKRADVPPERADVPSSMDGEAGEAYTTADGELQYVGNQPFARLRQKYSGRRVVYAKHVGEEVVTWTGTYAPGRRGDYLLAATQPPGQGKKVGELAQMAVVHPAPPTNVGPFKCWGAGLSIAKNAACGRFKAQRPRLAIMLGKNAETGLWVGYWRFGILSVAPTQAQATQQALWRARMINEQYA